MAPSWVQKGVTGEHWFEVWVDPERVKMGVCPSWAWIWMWVGSEGLWRLTHHESLHMQLYLGKEESCAWAL